MPTYIPGLFLWKRDEDSNDASFSHRILELLMGYFLISPVKVPRKINMGRH
jgi:hypothetical protein